MKKTVITAAAIGMTLGLGACSMPGKAPAKAPAQTTKEETTAQETYEEEAAQETGETEEEDMETAQFRSTAYVVQMEITTGLTTEYLDPLLNYPVKVVRQDKTEEIRNQADLDEMGLDALYTPELLAAVEEYDPENMEILDHQVLMGDPESAYVILEADENDVIGISEFHYLSAE